MVVDLAARDVSYQAGVMVIGTLGILMVGIRLVLIVHELPGRGDSLQRCVLLLVLRTIQLLKLLLIIIRLVA